MADSECLDNDLPPEANVVTEDLLKEALAHNGGSVVINSFKVSRASNKGENFSTVVVLVTGTATISGMRKEFDLFVKTNFESEFRRELTISRGDFFAREKEAYCKILPALSGYQKSLKLDSVTKLSVPQFLYGKTDYGKKMGVLVLENLRAKGFRLADKVNGLDLNHCRLAVREIAKWHALSLAMKDGNADNLKKVFGGSVFKQIQYSSLFADVQEKSFRDGIADVIKTLKSLTQNDKHQALLDKFQEHDVYSTMADFFKVTDSPFHVLNHGDFWTGNMMFSYAKDGEIPIEVKTVDLQLLVYSLPTRDLVYFMYISTTPEFRNLHLVEVLKCYHSHFHEILKKVQYECPSLTFNALEKMFKDSAIHGFLIGAYAARVLLANSEVYDNFDKPERKDRWVDVRKENLNDSAKERINNRLWGLFEEAVENRVFMK